MEFQEVTPNGGFGHAACRRAVRRHLSRRGRWGPLSGRQAAEKMFARQPRWVEALLTLRNIIGTYPKRNARTWTSAIGKECASVAIGAKWKNILRPQPQAVAVFRHAWSHDPNRASWPILPVVLPRDGSIVGILSYRWRLHAEPIAPSVAGRTATRVWLILALVALRYVDEANLSNLINGSRGSFPSPRF